VIFFTQKLFESSCSSDSHEFSRNAAFNYETLLADAVNLAFLRKVGGGYIFIHRYLLEYFAGLEIKEQ
jgi:hypothetical protein